MKPNKELAELTGILLGDGSISIYKKINHHRLKITLNSKEHKYSKHIKKLFENTFHEKITIKFRDTENTLDLLCYKRKTIRKLLDFGMIASPKWNRATIPKCFMNKKYGKYVLRGYFDTDGCLTITNNNGTPYPRIELKIMPSPMQNQFCELLKIFKFKFGKYQTGKGKIRIQINGFSELNKWKKIIGWSNPKSVAKEKEIKKRKK